MTIDLEQLKKAALACGGKEWTALHDTFMCDGGGDWEVFDQQGNSVVYVEHADDSPIAAHIATANPAVVLELIARLERAEAVPVAAAPDLYVSSQHGEWLANADDKSDSAYKWQGVYFAPVSAVAQQAALTDEQSDALFIAACTLLERGSDRDRECAVTLKDMIAAQPGRSE